MSGEDGLVVVDPGLLTTVQDAGRSGTGAMGVSPAGVADWFAATAANRLVGNEDGAALFEATLSGMTFEARCEMVIAVTGASSGLTIDGASRQLWRSWQVRRGDVVVLGPARRGLRSYVALGGGIAGAPVLGSLSTDVVAGFGGRILASGDVFGLRLRRDGPRRALAYPADQVERRDGPVRLRAMWGPDADLFDRLSFESALREPRAASPRSSRQALRLEGSAPASRMVTELLSAGVCAGCVQITGDGQPVVLLAEHQTTGGYAVPLCVIFADLPRAAQAAPGDLVTFEIVSAPAAREALRERVAQLRSLGPVGETAIDESRLAGGFLEGAQS